jgi:hypothetical protein
MVSIDQVDDRRSAHDRAEEQFNSAETSGAGSSAESVWRSAAAQEQPLRSEIADQASAGSAVQCVERHGSSLSAHRRVAQLVRDAAPDEERHTVQLGS